ncbi:lytic transglycosylase domain-containing protein [Lichenicoccus roseus]|uniref:lytic transglycosylase domain-containing protein n=1 Tax=Lichenicoccus roseus TaxID=2683649 RepID=UPI0026B11698
MVPYVACMALVASLYHLPPRVLPSIQAVEGGQPGVLHHNSDGTLDVGVMQINTRWLGPLSRYTGTPPTEVFLRLRYRPCYNIAASGAIMRTYLDEAHGNLLLAVGYYHSHTIELNLAYRRQVLNSARMLFMRPGRTDRLRYASHEASVPPG